MTVQFQLHDKQWQVYESNHRFKVVVAGRRFGKTVTVKTELIQTAAQNPGTKNWYVAPTYPMARQIMWDEIKDMIPPSWIWKVNESLLQIRLKNKSIIELKGADRKDTLRGVGLKLVALDEIQDMHPDVWYKVLRPTLSASNGRAICTGTPKGYNLLYDLFKYGQDKDLIRAGEWRSWQFTTMDSPFVPYSEVEAAKRELDPKSFRQEYMASFETMSGRVYYAIDRDKHVGDYPFNPKLPIWIGQDFNIDPMSSVVCQPQPNGELWAVDEAILFSSNTKETCEELDKKFWRYQDAVTIYPDPNAKSRQSARGETDIDIFKEHGFGKIRAKNRTPDIVDRVNAVNSMLEACDGSIRLRVNKRCKHLIKGLEQTIYKPGTPDIDKSAGVEHPTDALGYLIDLEYPIRKQVAQSYSY